MQVFVVLTGCTGDISIANIFKTEDLALKWIAENKNQLYAPSIEPWGVYGKTKDIKCWQGIKE